MIQGQNQSIMRIPYIHCQKGVLNCEKCQEIFQYQYMLLDFDTFPMHASPMIKHEGVLKAYKVIKVFDSLTDAQNYAKTHNIPIEISELDKDEILQKIQAKVKELGWHINLDDDKLRIFSVYPVKEIETGKKVLPEVIYTLRPLNSKINYFVFYTEKFKVVDKEYFGIHSKMNPVQNHEKEDALQKIRELEKFLYQFYPK